MIHAASSLILSLSSLMHTPCDVVFYDTVMEFHKMKKITLESEDEGYLLKDFAAAACRTNNPDILWKIAATESGLRPLIARDNVTSKVYHGDLALERTVVALQDRKLNNVDAGILQINIKAHGLKMGALQLYPLNPVSQVRYVVNEMTPELIKKCGNNHWVGCYHSWQSKQKRATYQRLIIKQEKMLEVALERVGRKYKTKLAKK
jgi:hypothetical protein